MRYTLNNMTSVNYVRRAEDRQSKIQSFAFVISVCGCVLLSIGFGGSSLVGAELSFEIGLDERVNPNDAPIASLVRLPGIGVGRAEAIVAYRENLDKEGQNKAFQNGDDLQKVKGIGPKTAQNIRQWLTFE
ncbi:MAG TPA: helix-hairpin-helix domain-containing protein [Sedimentisphaerales bacterium]|nr:helix-hairpin-helix domain-containing protein [Sedimentisphaerales bacterium]